MKQGFKEEEIEIKLIENLINLGYLYNTNIKNELDLMVNIKNRLESLNKTLYTNEEFENISSKLCNNTVEECFHLLKHTSGPVLRGIRKNHCVKLIDFENFDNNFFEVVNQLSTRDNHRYDVLLLVNGLPLIQIELKRPGVDIYEAFNQVKRYKNNLMNNIFNFIHVFILSNDISTRYFANNSSGLSDKLAFKVQTDSLTTLGRIEDVVNHMLTKEKLIAMLNENMVFNSANNSIVVLKSHQINGKNAAIRDIDNQQDGCIFHATGSGKTLTAFALSSFLSNRNDIDAVILLVDRKDLDSQMTNTFNKFQEGCVDQTKTTDVLLEQLKNINTQNKMIISTIQKMNNAITINPEEVKPYKDYKIVFIIDECHRSQCGVMHENIRNHFKNSQYIGFTGTPIFDKNSTSENDKTEDIFGKISNKYQMKDAINDNCTLPFYVEHYKTYDLSEDVKDEKVYSINSTEALESEKRITNIVKYINSIHDNKTNNREFSAMLTARSIEAALKYKDAFDKYTDLKTIVVFSAESDNAVYNNKSIVDIRKDLFQNMSRTLDIPLEMIKNESVYKSLATSKVKTVDIDILIVVDMFLTGFDAKKLNTLYIDKKMRYHTLIQAMSRTNRVDPGSNAKTQGNILCFQPMKKEVDEALKLFNSGSDDMTIILVPEAKELKIKLNEEVKKLRNIVPKPTPENFNALKGQKRKREYVAAFRNVLTLVRQLEQQDLFNRDEDLDINNKEYELYKLHYGDIYRDVNKNYNNNKTSILGDLNFKIDLIGNPDYVTFDYIIEKIGVSSKVDYKKQVVQLINKTNDPIVKDKKGLLIKFIETQEYDPQEDDIYSIFDAFSNRELNREVTNFAVNNNIDRDFLSTELFDIQKRRIINEDNIIRYIENSIFLSEDEKTDLFSNIMIFFDYISNKYFK